MNNLFIFLLMIFCHVLDDYYMQGQLKELKQKKWWREQTNKKMYKYDWIVALIVHSFSWSFMIMLPITIFMNFQIGILFLIVFILNLIIHAIIDNAKANLFKINLIADQSMHFLQIILTFIVLIIVR